MHPQAADLLIKLRFCPDQWPAPLFEQLCLSSLFPKSPSFPHLSHLCCLQARQARREAAAAHFAPLMPAQLQTTAALFETWPTAALDKLCHALTLQTFAANRAGTEGKGQKERPFAHLAFKTHQCHFFQSSSQVLIKTQGLSLTFILVDDTFRRF
jgi:hypothetical protein